MRYQITQQFLRGPETSIQRAFKTLDDVQQFLTEKLDYDASLKLQVTYRVYEDEIKIDEWDQARWQQEGVSSQGQSQNSGEQFHPSPFQVAPRVGPASSFRNMDEEEND